MEGFIHISLATTIRMTLKEAWEFFDGHIAPRTKLETEQQGKRGAWKLNRLLASYTTGMRKYWDIDGGPRASHWMIRTCLSKRESSPDTKKSIIEAPPYGGHSAHSSGDLVPLIPNTGEPFIHGLCARRAWQSLDAD